MVLHQTLQDKDPDYAEKNGPFKCTNYKAWLGEGYYFWDTHIELAHWWGQSAHARKYLICSSFIDFDETCWDLHGTGEHRLEFLKACKRIVKEGLSTKNDLRVPNVISYLKKAKAFPYKAIRALGMNSIGQQFHDPRYVYRVKFITKLNTYIDLYPPVQLCLLSQQALSLRKYTIVYPKEYIASDFA